MTDPVLWLVSKLCRLAAAFLSSVVKLQPLVIFQLLSLVNSEKGQLEIILTRCF